MTLTKAQPPPTDVDASPGAAPSRRAPWRAVEDEFAAGLRNHWYALVPSAEVGARPLALTRLGEDLVLWRDGGGQPHLFPDACAHRGAPPILGRRRRRHPALLLSRLDL